MTALAMWQSHKVVHAGKIMSIISPGGIDTRKCVLQVQNADGTENEMKVDSDVFKRGIPNTGDYLVVYDDGYTSWSPRQAFEGGYKRV